LNVVYDLLKKVSIFGTGFPEPPFHLKSGKCPAGSLMERRKKRGEANANHAEILISL
jgi:hypothetical protein